MNKNKFRIGKTFQLFSILSGDTSYYRVITKPDNKNVHLYGFEQHGTTFRTWLVDANDTLSLSFLRPITEARYQKEFEKFIDSLLHLKNEQAKLAK